MQQKDKDERHTFTFTVNRDQILYNKGGYNHENQTIQQKVGTKQKHDCQS